MLIKKRFFFAVIMGLLIPLTYSQSKKTEAENSEKIQKVLMYFREKDNKEQYDAALFIIKNIPIHYSEDNIWLDKSGRDVSFKVTRYRDIEEASKAFNELKNSGGMIP